jgi:hypothetical protein
MVFVHFCNHGGNFHLFRCNPFVIALCHSPCFLWLGLWSLVFWQPDWLWRADWVWAQSDKPQAQDKLVNRALLSRINHEKASLSLSLMSINNVNKRKKLRGCFIAARLGLLQALLYPHLQCWRLNERQPGCQCNKLCKKGVHVMVSSSTGSTLEKQFPVETFIFRWKLSFFHWKLFSVETILVVEVAKMK